MTRITALNFRSLCLSLIFVVACSQPSLVLADAGMLQAAVKECVAVTVRIQAGRELSSGIAVSSTGLILCANHGLPESSQTVTVRTAGGKVFSADIQRRFPEQDLALLQAKLLGQRMKHAVLSSAKLNPGQHVIATGFPARQPKQKKSLPRFGRVDQLDSQLIRSTCQLTAGDSGGGLFDLDGRLVAINQRIGKAASANIHLGISECLKLFPELRLSATVTATRADSWSPIEREPVQAALQYIAVEIHLNDSPQQRPRATRKALCRGTLWDSQTVVTKLSELPVSGSLLVKSDNGSQTVGRVIVANRIHDLAVVKLTEPLPFVAHLAARVSEYLLVADAGSFDIGVLGRIRTEIPRTSPVLGCSLQADASGLTVTLVRPNSAASMAGVQVDDLIQQVDAVNVTRFDLFAEVMGRFQPGDRCKIQVSRKGTDLTLLTRMQHDPANLLQRSEHLDGAAPELSLRRTGFPKVLQHDLRSKPNEMGGPLLTMEGHLLGVNIAVSGREAVLAIPFDVVNRIVRQVDD